MSFSCDLRDDLVDDLFGVRQTWLHFRGRPYTPLRFGVRGLYRHIRHPLYAGWIIAFWATPTMTVTHLVFAGLMTTYMLLAIPLEERDLVAHRGAAYEEYRRAVPALVPTGRRTDAGDVRADREPEAEPTPPQM